MDDGSEPARAGGLRGWLRSLMHRNRAGRPLATVATIISADSEEPAVEATPQAATAADASPDTTVTAQTPEPAESEVPRATSLDAVDAVDAEPAIPAEEGAAAAAASDAGAVLIHGESSDAAAEPATATMVGAEPPVIGREEPESTPADTAPPEPGWRVIGSSVRGAAHVRSGLPRQDAMGWEPASGEGLPLIVSVADGHGSAKCFRSDRGSRFAVAAALTGLQRLLDGQPDLGNFSAVKRVAEQSLPREIAREWDAAVAADLDREPFTAAELSGLTTAQGDRARHSVERNPRHAYGTTLLAALITVGFLLYLQLGDGDLLTVAEDGTVDRPVPSDARLFANETTSLSGDSAWRDMRLGFEVVTGAPPALVLLSTDGYANSFRSDDDFRQVGPDLLSMLRTDGPQTLSGELEDWLNEASRSGSGDDVTLGVAFRSAAIAPSAGIPEEQVDEPVAEAPPPRSGD
jgi:hypothetical protein